MKTLIKKTIFAALIAVAFTSCSKKNDNQPAAAASSFTLDGTSYSASTTVFTNNTLLAVAKSNSQVTIGLFFTSRPVAGNYTVVGNPKTNRECSIDATGGGILEYLSNGSNNGEIKVVINNGKIHAIFSDVTVNNMTDQSNATVSGDLTEE
jgi:hypothetical protein